MLSKYKKAVSQMPWAVQLMLRHHFSLPIDQHKPLFPLLEQANLTQADVVLVLLRDGRPEMVEQVTVLTGVEVQHCPPWMPPDRPAPVSGPAREGDRRRFTHVGANPRLPTTPAFQRYKHFKVGRTVADFLRRGGTRKDLREALRAGWVEMEDSR